MQGHVDVVNLLLRAMERPFNMPNKEGRTAAQADPTANLVPQDNENLTPLHCAAAEVRHRPWLDGATEPTSTCIPRVHELCRMCACND